MISTTEVPMEHNANLFVRLLGKATVQPTSCKYCITYPSD